MKKNNYIILDTCVYLRLALHIHPLLGTPFGKNKFRCYLHPDFEAEYTDNENLENNFNWVKEPIYIENRKKCFTITAEQREKMDLVYDQLHTLRLEHKLSTRYYDLRCLSVAYVLNEPIATDDTGLRKLANINRVKKYNTIELLGLMRANKHINNETILKIIRHWNLSNDEPYQCVKYVKNILGMDFKAIIKKT